jgi:hypothetical protein
MISKALFRHERQLLPFNFTRVRTTEFITCTNASFAKGNEIKVIEVSVAKPGHEPLQAFWQPAKGSSVERVRQCKHAVQPGRNLSLENQLSKGAVRYFGAGERSFSTVEAALPLHGDAGANPKERSDESKAALEWLGNACDVRKDTKPSCNSGLESQNSIQAPSLSSFRFQIPDLC